MASTRAVWGALLGLAVGNAAGLGYLVHLQNERLEAVTRELVLLRDELRAPARGPGPAASGVAPLVVQAPTVQAPRPEEVAHLVVAMLEERGLVQPPDDAREPPRTPPSATAEQVAAQGAAQQVVERILAAREVRPEDVSALRQQYAAMRPEDAFALRARLAAAINRQELRIPSEPTFRMP